MMVYRLAQWIGGSGGKAVVQAHDAPNLEIAACRARPGEKAPHTATPTINVIDAVMNARAWAGKAADPPLTVAAERLK